MQETLTEHHCGNTSGNMLLQLISINARELLLFCLSFMLLFRVCTDYLYLIVLNLNPMDYLCTACVCVRARVRLEVFT